MVRGGRVGWGGMELFKDVGVWGGWWGGWQGLGVGVKWEDSQF